MPLKEEPMSAVSLPDRKIASAAKKPIGVRFTPLYLSVVGPVVSLWAYRGTAPTAMAKAAPIPRIRERDMSDVAEGEEPVRQAPGSRGRALPNVDRTHHGLDMGELRSCNDACPHRR